jgi:hypothetical protein
MTVESIKTEAEYCEALKEIEGLMTATPNTAEGNRLAQLAALVERYEQTTYGPKLESLLRDSPREAFSLTQEDREWLHHSLPSEDPGRWNSWFEKPSTTPDFFEDRDQPDEKDEQ